MGGRARGAGRGPARHGRQPPWDCRAHYALPPHRPVGPAVAGGRAHRAGSTALTNRIRTVGDLSREFWAGQENGDYSYGSTAPEDGDFYLDLTGKVRW